MKPVVHLRSHPRTWLVLVALLGSCAGTLHAQVTLRIGDAAKRDGDAIYQALEPAQEKKSDTGTVMSLNCGHYRLYAYGKDEPPQSVLSFKKVSASKVPVGIRLLLETTSEGSNWYETELPAGLCEVKVALPEGYSWFSHRLGAGPEGASGPCTTDTGTCCEPGCGPCDGHARYRITYDVAADRICVMKKVRGNGGEEWRTLTGRKPILRPNVHRFVEVRMVNFNDLVGAPKLEYRFENLHQEYGDLFATAFMKVPSTPTPAPVLPEDSAGATSKDTSGINIAAADSNAKCDLMADMEQAGTKIAALLKESVGSVTDVEKGFKAALSELCNKDMEPAGIVAGKVDLKARCIALVDPDSLCDETKLLAVRESLVKAYYRAGAHAIKQLHESFAKRLKEAKALPITPDKEAMKVELDKEIAEAFTAAWWSLLEGFALQPKLDSVVDKAADLKVLPEGVKQDELHKLVKELQQLYHDLTTYTNYALAPIQMKDMDLLHLQFKLGDNKLNDMPYEFHLAGGWKIDFSAGIAITGLQDHKYFYSDVRQETVQQVDAQGDTSSVAKNYATIRESTRSPFDWSAAVMAHAYSRTAIVPAVGMTMGVLLRPESVRWLGGTSVMLGHRHRFVLSGGVAVGKAKRLADGKELAVEIELSTDQLNTTPSVEEFTDVGWFFAVSYNIAGVQLTR